MMDKKSEERKNDENINNANKLSPIQEEYDDNLSNQSLNQINNENEPSFFDDSDQIENLELSTSDCTSLPKNGKILSMPSYFGSSPNTTRPKNFNVDGSVISVDRSSIQNQPSTPPEVLREKIYVVEKDFECLKNEHDELLEFTSLEKQLIHDNCISRDEVNDEITSLNQRIEDLIEENVFVKKKLEEREENVSNLQITLSEYKCEAKNLIKSLLFNACSKYENFPQDISNSPLLKDLLDKSDFDDMHKTSVLFKQPNNLSEIPFEELRVLRNFIIVEIITMDSNESEEDLLTCTSEEIFSKFMQAVIKKENEVSSNFKYYIEKLEENNEKLKNSLNSQNSWIQELENENEKLNKDLNKINCIHNDSLSKTKALSYSLEITESQLSMMKTEFSKLESDNDYLNTELNKLKELNQLKMISSTAACQTEQSVETEFESNKVDKKHSNTFEQEISMFADFINSIKVESNGITLAGCDNFVILKDSVEQVQDKLLYIQDHFNSQILKLEGDFHVKQSQLIDIKNNFENICKHALDNNKQLLCCFPNTEEGFKLACGDIVPQEIMSSSYNIDKVRDDCLVINDLANTLKNRIEGGRYLIRKLSKHNATIQCLIQQKEDHIENLSKTIKKETNLSKIREMKISELEKELLRLNEVLAINKEKLHDHERAVSKIKSLLIKQDDGNLNEDLHLNEIVQLVQEKLNACDKVVIDCDFFSRQCMIIIDYSLQLRSEYDDLHCQVNESKMLLKHMNKYAPLLKMQFSDVTMHKIIDNVNQIFSEYLFLRGNQESLEKKNSNLKFELDSSQDSIRQLRAELRNLRKQDRSRSYENSLKHDFKTNDLSTQTEFPTCENERLLSDLKESLRKSNSRILNLEVQIQNEDFPNLKRAQLCEKSLTQAKEKITSLQMDLIYHRRNNQELIQQIKMLKSCKQSDT